MRWKCDSKFFFPFILSNWCRCLAIVPGFRVSTKTGNGGKYFGVIIPVIKFTNCYNQHSICQDSKNKLRPLNNLLCILRTLGNQYKLPDLRSKQECLKTN
jgi:formate/nitrite transporter FocA (FNT family)